MKKLLNSKNIFKLLITSFVIIVFGTVIGCASSTPLLDKSGAELWGENCGHCHNVRPPDSLTDAEWEVAVTHMRSRANLNGVEAQKIVDFLKTAN